MKLIISILSILFSLSAYGQNYDGRLGINTPKPEATVHIAASPTTSNSKGDLKLDYVETGSVNDSILVLHNGFVKKISASDLLANTPAKCPEFLKSESNSYSIHFKSASSIPNPNNPLIIETLNFAASGSYIQNNMYLFNYSNTSAKPLNINNFTVHFGSRQCNYQ